jgi:hypothetical protein
MATQRISIAVSGPLPPIPGTLSPGIYDIDWQARTATWVAPLAAAAGEATDAESGADVGASASAEIAENVPSVVSAQAESSSVLLSPSSGG